MWWGGGGGGAPGAPVLDPPLLIAGVPVHWPAHTCQIEKRQYFSKSRPLFHWTWIRQTKYLIMMTSEVSTKIVLLGRVHISHKQKIHNFFRNLFFSQH